MPRPRLKIGEHGDVHLWQRADRRWQARVQVRDRDGEVRQVAALGPTKGAAKRALQRRLTERRDPSLSGVTGEMSVQELAAFWLSHRAAHGKARGKGAIAPQTLAAYDDAIKTMIAPALGNVRVSEIRVGLLDSMLARIETGADGGRSRGNRALGRSTGQARSVLKQMFDLAVRHGALVANPMGLVEPTSRAPSGDLGHLTVEEAVLLRHVVRREFLRIPGRRMPNRDLEEWVDVVLGTGCRDGEALAIRWADLDLDSLVPTVHIRGTIIESRGRYVEHLHRQDTTKSRVERTLILPSRVVDVFRSRLTREHPHRAPAPEGPVFATSTGHWVSPANIRSRLRKAVTPHEPLRGTSPHTLRRSVGTLVAHEPGLDAARDQLGHSDPSVTFQHYVGKRMVAPDLRPVLDAFFAPLPPLPSENVNKT